MTSKCICFYTNLHMNITLHITMFTMSGVDRISPYTTNCTAVNLLQVL